jgi:hypothetical protein
MVGRMFLDGIPIDGIANTATTEIGGILVHNLEIGS